MTERDPLSDPPLTPEQSEKASSLTSAELEQIDSALLRQVSSDWRKIARVVGTAMMEHTERVRGVPDVFYAQRLRRMIQEGRLEAEGDVRAMGRGEVRLPTQTRGAI
jgi:hypothetical protein